MVAVGTAVMTTVAVAVTAAHLPAAALVYVTVYVPAVLVEGVMVPLVLTMVKPAGAAVYVPPV